MPEEAKTYRIGYAFAPKKDEGLLQPCLLDLAKQRGIELVVIDLTKPLIDQGPFHCIMHKLYNPEWTNQLHQYLAQNPNVIIVDSPDAIDRIHNRITMLQAFEEVKITHEGTSVAVPKQVFVESPERIDLENLNFPVIAKPAAVDGSLSSHQMYLVYNEKGLEELKSKLNPPFLLQEFVNHGGVVFKVYAAGKHVRCVKRRSLKDVTAEEESQNLLSFSQISNLSPQDQSDELIKAAEMPPERFVEELASEMGRVSKLNLFNFDMIRDSKNKGRYYVIDINYFPGFAKVPGYEKMMVDFFLDILQQNRGDSSPKLVKCCCI